MQRSNNSFYVISLILIFVVAMFFLSWKIVLPRYEKNKNELKKVENEIVSAHAKLESLQVAKRDIDELGPIFNKIFVAIPKDKDEANLISEIEAIANINKLTLPAVQITDSSEASSQASSLQKQNSTTEQPITVSFNVSGGFEDIGNFTAALENDLKFMNIRNLTLSLGDGKISASYQIEIYQAQNSALLSDSISTNSNLTTEAE